MSRNSIVKGYILFDLFLIIFLLISTKATISNGFRITYLFELLFAALFIANEAAFFRRSTKTNEYFFFAVLFECFSWCVADVYISRYIGPSIKENLYFKTLPDIMSWWQWVFPAAMIVFHVLAYFPAKAIAGKVNINKDENQKYIDGAKGGMYGLLGFALGTCLMFAAYSSLKNSPYGLFIMVLIAMCVVEFLSALVVAVLLLVNKKKCGVNTNN